MPDISINEFFPGGSKIYFIAVQNYREPIDSLSSPIADVERLKQVFREHSFDVVPVVSYTKETGEKVALTNPLIDPTSEDVLGFLSGIQTKDDERVVLYFAGHGTAIDSKGDPCGFFLPSNAEHDKPGTFVSMESMLARINTFSCRHLLIILDCCYAGCFRWADNTRSAGTEVPKTIYYERFGSYANNKAWQVITSSAHDQKAVDTLRLGQREPDANNQDGKLSPFASLLATALETGAADLSYDKKPTDGIITATELGFYLRQQISEDLSTYGMPANKQQIPMLFPLRGHGKGEFVFLNLKKASSGKICLENWTDKNPYKGLNAYTADDAGIFYGRKRILDGWMEDAIKKEGLVKLALSHQLIILTGPSGIGKSSLVKAGLHPAIGNQFTLVDIRPGKTPHSSHRSKLRSILHSSRRHMILIDQYEELVTVCQSAIERENFETSLVRLLKKNHHLVVTIRSDFESQFKESPLLRIEPHQRSQKCRFVVPPFLREEIHEMVTRPAAQEVLEFKNDPFFSDTPEQFVGRIVDDAFQNPGSIPLLSLALSTLYESKHERNLLESSYKGVIGILDQKVSAIYKKYKEDVFSNNMFKNLICRALSIESGRIAKRRIYYNRELVFSDKKKTGAINRMRKELEHERERLFTSDKDHDFGPYTEPSHDAFLRSWPQLTQWLTEKNMGHTGQSDVLLLRGVGEIAQTYADEKDKRKRKKYLWINDPRLDEARKRIADQLNAEEEIFVNDSYKKRTSNRKWLRASVIFAVLAIATGGIIAWVQANRSARQARKNQALYYASSTESLAPHRAFAAFATADSMAPDEPMVYDYFLDFSKKVTNLNAIPSIIQPGTGVIEKIEFDKTAGVLHCIGRQSIIDIEVSSGKRSTVYFTENIRKAICIDSAVWLIQTKSAVYKLADSKITDSVKTEDGRALTTLNSNGQFAFSDNQVIYIYDAKKVSLKESFSVSQSIYRLAFAPNNNVMLVVGGTEYLKRFKRKSGKWIFVDSVDTYVSDPKNEDNFQEQPQQIIQSQSIVVIKEIDFSPSGNYFTTRTDFEKTKIFELLGKCVDSFSLEVGPPEQEYSKQIDILGPVWSTRHDMYVSGAGNLYLNKLEKGKWVRKKIRTTAATVKFSNERDVLHIMDGNILHTEDFNGETQLDEGFQPSSSFTGNWQYFEKRDGLVLLNNDNSVDILDPFSDYATNLTPLDNNETLYGESNSFVFSNDGRYFAAYDNDYTVYIWDTDKLELISQKKKNATENGFALPNSPAVIGYNSDGVFDEMYYTGQPLVSRCDAPDYTKRFYTASRNGSLVLFYNDACAQGIYNLRSSQFYKTTGWQDVKSAAFNKSNDTVIIQYNNGRSSYWQFNNQLPAEIHKKVNVRPDTLRTAKYEAFYHDDDDVDDTLILYTDGKKKIFSFNFPGALEFNVSPTGTEFMIAITKDGITKYKLYTQKGVEIKEFYFKKATSDIDGAVLSFSPDGLRILIMTEKSIDTKFSVAGMKHFFKLCRPLVLPPVTWGPVYRIEAIADSVSSIAHNPHRSSQE